MGALGGARLDLQAALAAIRLQGRALGERERWGRKRQTSDLVGPFARPVSEVRFRISGGPRLEQHPNRQGWRVPGPAGEGRGSFAPRNLISAILGKRGRAVQKETPRPSGSQIWNPPLRVGGGSGERRVLVGPNLFMTSGVLVVAAVGASSREALAEFRERGGAKSASLKR